MSTKIANFLTKYSDKVQREIPEGYSVEQVKRLSLHLMGKNSALAKCSVESIYLGVLKAAHLDLALDLGEAHLVPYGKEADFQIDYKGYIKLAKRSGGIKHVKADVVRSGDEFFYQRSLNPSERVLVHRPIPFNDGEIIGSYAIFDLSTGYGEFEILSRAEINKIRGKAAAGSMMWKEFFEEGAKKAVLRRGIKTLELMPEDKRAILSEVRDHYDIDSQHKPTQDLNARFAPPPAAIDHKETIDLSSEEVAEEEEITV